MAVQIRQMRNDPDEVSAVAALRHSAFFEDTDRTANEDAAGLFLFLSDAPPPAAAFVAEVDGQLAGTCLLATQELDQRHDVGPWLAGLVVDPAFRGLGIGTDLVRAVTDHANGQGVGRLYLYTDDAGPFYARFGWVVIDRFLDSIGVPSVLMAVDLE